MLTASLVGGSVSVSCNMNTDIDSKMVTPSEIFSPDSGGNVKPSNVIELVS